MFINARTDTITVEEPHARPDPELLDRLGKAPATNVGDVFQRMLVLDGGIRAHSEKTSLVGTALPVRAGDNLAIHRALDEAQPGDVLVINGQADLSRAVIGDLIGEIMVNQGVLGAIIDGAVRDVEALSAQGLVVFARAVTPAGPFKNGPGTIGSPVAIGGVVVSAGDIVVADADGVAIVPADRAEWAADRVEQVIEHEEQLRHRITAARSTSAPPPRGRGGPRPPPPRPAHDPVPLRGVR
ncbi:RraA family protein [Saccharopolyspora mangrovi]|uniref:Putative 4-hydroxy-4-methyl-2-oxoglutarate aldolase n=1 Tax=Saccharopolyspora mangrovi TaxID=3082379 RepID=A0ABU6AKQ6_9PSEU|nr:RraA family protein [Saccharopolyspora sp. S2-29]MEB3372143.1 RraA family protein [Saccharopolyspora sp. S2-29]